MNDSRQDKARGAGMKISVVVPAFNEEKLLGASLASMRAAMSVFDGSGWASELIVCDNNSTDRTAEIARAAGASVVFEPVNQIGRARNRGASVASGDWIIFVDADSHPAPELFADVRDAILTGKYLYGGATVVLDEQAAHPMARRVTTVWNTISRVFKYAAGSFIFVETAGFREIGGFDSQLFVSEELDLCKRLWKLAKKQGKGAIILTGHPLVTSARKMHLYSKREHLTFMLRTVFGFGGTLRNRDACKVWYDGRR